MRPPHSGGGVETGGSEATTAAVSTSNEAAKAEQLTGHEYRLCHCNWWETQVALYL